MELKQKWASFKEHYILYNIFWVVVSIVALMVVAHLSLTLLTRHGAHREVPNFAGVDIEEALQMAKQSDVDLIVNDSIYMPAYPGGMVVEQLPEAGVEVKPGRSIYITITSYDKKRVKIPYVAGLSLRQAKNMLEVAGLSIKELIYQPDLATNYVLEERYEGKMIHNSSNREAPLGAGITLYVGVSSGEGVTNIPRLSGMSTASAKSALWELGLNVGHVRFDNDINLLNQKEAKVYMQSPSAGMTVTLGQEVDIYLTLDPKKVKKGGTPKESRPLIGAHPDFVESDTTALTEETSMETAPEPSVDQNDEFF